MTSILRPTHDVLKGPERDLARRGHEATIRGCKIRALYLIVGDDLDLSVLEDSNTAVGRSKIDSHGGFASSHRV